MLPARSTCRTLCFRGFAADGVAHARRARGFTIVELLMVMAVMAILFSLSFTTVRGAKQRGAIGKARAELAALTQALEDYKRHYGDYPQTGNAPQATPVTSAAIGSVQAQALL